MAKTKKYWSIIDGVANSGLPQFLIQKKLSKLDKKSRKCNVCGKQFIPKRYKHYTCYECWNEDEKEDSDDERFSAYCGTLKELKDYMETLQFKLLAEFDNSALLPMDNFGSLAIILSTKPIVNRTVFIQDHDGEIIEKDVFHKDPEGGAFRYKGETYLLNQFLKRR